MLKSPTRPRAPSAATLRVLYQLAYISSGTAVGIGALCAEERRRRTQIVQRVADNAKRIRQSPRYAHGAAAAAVRQHEFEEISGWESSENELESLLQVSADRANAGKLENHGGAKMPELPSVVEEEYGHLVEGNHKKSRRRNHTGRPDFVEEHGNRESVARTELDAQNDPRIRQIPTLATPRSAAWRKEASRSDLSSKDAESGSSWDWIIYKRQMQFGVSEGSLKATNRKIWTKPFHATREGKAYANPESNYGTVIRSFDTHQLWGGKYSTAQDLSSTMLTQDIDLFFHKVDVETVPRMNTRHAHMVADELLRLSLNINNSVKETRSLLLWKIATDGLSINDFHNIATSFQQIAQSLEPDDTMQFYEDLFATRTYEIASKAEKLSIRLRIYAEALELDNLEQSTRWYECVIENIPLASKIDQATVADLLERECRRLIDNGHLPLAVKLWCMTMSNRPATHGVYGKFYNELFDLATTARYLSLCAQMLRIKDRDYTSDNTPQKNALISACYEEDAVGMLQSLFGPPGTGALLKNNRLSQQSYAYLCHCFSHTKGMFKMFLNYYHRLSADLRTSVAEQSVAVGALALKADWKATRNFDLVFEKYEHTSKQLKQTIGADTRPLDHAMVEVELSANKPLEAIGAIARLNQGGSDGDIAALTALALAKQKNWLAFGRLFEALKHDRSTWNWTPTMKRAYNNALYLFSRSHSAQQLSEFVSMSINELRFRPNQATWEVLMSSLVSKKAIVLLKHWIKFPVTPESTANLNAGIAAALMKTWYLDFRQSHVLVIWLCRTLTQAAPSLHSDALLDLVRETIGYDLRKLHGVNAPWMEPIIRARQTIYQHSSEDIPLSGWVWNGQLYTNGQLVTAGEVPSELPMSREKISSLPLPDPQREATTRAVDTGSVVETWNSYDGSGKDSKTHDGVESVEPANAPESTMVPGAAATQEAVSTPVSAPSQPESRFEDLRPSYEIDSYSSKEESTAAVEVHECETLERQMVSQLSDRQYESVIKFYQESLDPVGLPASPMVLEIALEASLRVGNGRHEAESMMSAARDAGMNVRCAMGPLLMDQIRHTPLVDTQSAAQLRSFVIEYYRMNELSGLHVNHHLGTMAAHEMIQAGFAQHGINLLSTIMQSSWSADKPLDIGAMSVWIAGYAALGHVKGMHWVIREVLDQRMGIDKGFLRALKRARRPLLRLDNGALGFSRQGPKTQAYLRQWYVVCSRRREAQMHESKVLGRKLVNLLASAANGGSPRTTPRRNRRRALSYQKSKRLPGKVEPVLLGGSERASRLESIRQGLVQRDAFDELEFPDESDRAEIRRRESTRQGVVQRDTFDELDKLLN